MDAKNDKLINTYPENLIGKEAFQKMKKKLLEQRIGF